MKKDYQIILILLLCMFILSSCSPVIVEEIADSTIKDIDLPVYVLNDICNKNDCDDALEDSETDLKLYRIEGTSFQSLKDTPDSYKEEQDLWVRCKKNICDIYDKKQNDNVAYTLKFDKTGSDSYGIPICTSANTSIEKKPTYEECNIVKLKFLGEDWVISDTKAPSEQEIVIGEEMPVVDLLCPDGSKPTCLRTSTAYGIVRLGDSLTLDDGSFVTLDEINSDDPSAVVSIYDSDGNKIGTQTIQEGSTSSEGKTKIRVYKTQPGYTFGAKWAEIAIKTEELELCECPKDYVLPQETIDIWELHNADNITVDADTRIISGEVDPVILIEWVDQVKKMGIVVEDLVNDVKESDVSVSVNENYITLTTNNFPIFDNTNISDIKLVPDRDEDETTFDIYLNGEEVGETGDIKNGDTEPIIDINWDASQIRLGSDLIGISTDKNVKSGDIVINVITNTIASAKSGEDQITFSIDDNTVLMDDDIIIAEKHSPLGLNFMVRKGTGAVGSTVSEKSANSKKGGIIQYEDFDSSNDLVYYYVTDVEGPKDRGDAGETGTVTLTKAGTNKKEKLDWTVTDVTDFVTYGKMDDYDIYVYDFQDFPDGLAFDPSSTDFVTYETVIGSFTGDTDWVTYSKLIFDDGEIELQDEGGGIEIIPTGFTGDIKALINTDDSVTLIRGEGQTTRVFAELKNTVQESIILEEKNYLDVIQKGLLLIVLGESFVTEKINSACGKLTYPSGDEGYAEYDKVKMASLIKNSGTNCPLLRPTGTKPIIIFVK